MFFVWNHSVDAFFFSYVCNIRKELGKWLMDIAKYWVTAVLLSSIITDMGNSWILYLSVSFSVVLTLSVGLWVSSNLVGINFQYSLYIPFFASWKTITYKCWHV